jgi:phage FluMu protein Com
MREEKLIRQKREYHVIRCEFCGARLFDSSAPSTDDYGAGIEVGIKCWKCKMIDRVYLSIPVMVGVIRRFD